MKYFAYGYNCNLVGMQDRCPAAQLIGPANLPDFRLRFAVHADVVEDPSNSVSGVLWEITDECLAQLDQFEGYPHYYDRAWVSVIQDDIPADAMVYYMQPGHIEQDPWPAYWDKVIEGYVSNNVDTSQLFAALMKKLKAVDD